MSRFRKKEILTSSQRTDFERQLFALCLKNDDIRAVVQKAYDDFTFIYDETEMPLADFGKKYCELILKNKVMLFNFKDIPMKLTEPPSSYYVYRNDVLEKIYSMLLSANLI